MNSKISEESPSTSQEDNNANLDNGKNPNQSKGAIPKTKNYLRCPQNGKKKFKMNNNIETISPCNVEGSRCGILKVNGFSNSIGNNTSANNIHSGPLKKTVHEYEKIDPTLSIAASLQDIHLEVASTSSSSDDNDLSISDDGCIYTYKGDNAADLPSSFYNFELPILDNDSPHEQRDGNSSPEMDFLEMDFDPGPSGDADSESSSSLDLEEAVLPLETNETTVSFTFAEQLNYVEVFSAEGIRENITSVISSSSSNIKEKDLNNELHCDPVENEINMPWSCTLSERTKASKQLRPVKMRMYSFEELPTKEESPRSDNTPLICDDTIYYDENERIMIWNNSEACSKQVTQIGTTSCGTTAVLNVLTALRLPLPSIETIQESVQNRLYENFDSLPEYLLSRSIVGCNHKEIITSLKEVSDGRVYARFFSMYPERFVNICKWLGFWIQQGAVPIATLNIQNCDGPIPDGWHHQMIYGVDNNNVYLTNPLECVNSGSLWHQLVSESVLLISRADILSRWNPKTDIVEFKKMKDIRWRHLNVLGQVAKIIREQPRESRENLPITSHIRIPVNLKSGIILAIDIESAAYPLLRECPELPILNISNTT